MASQVEKLDWFSEHLRYDYDMFRLTYELIHREPVQRVQWMYNISYEAFAVHARVLKEFLGTKTDNYKARDFVPKFKHELGDLQGPFRNLDQQVFHPASDRKIGPEKIDLNRECESIYEWVRVGFEKFIAKLEEPFKGVWLEKNEALEKFLRDLNVTPAVTTSIAATATNQILAVSFRTDSPTTLTASLTSAEKMVVVGPKTA